MYNIQRVTHYQKNIYLYDIGHLASDVLQDINKLTQCIDRDFYKVDISQHNIHLITTCLYEGLTADMTESVMTILASKFPAGFRGSIFTAVSLSDIRFNFETLPAFMAQHGDYIEIVKSWREDRTETDHKFLCLNRRPSLIREKLIWNLCQDLDPNDWLMSLGSNQQIYNGPKEFLHHNRLIDGIADSYELQHALMMKNPVFRRCAVKIITETTEQKSTTQVDSIWITEKTFKCFFLKSLPIWMAVPGTVDHVRSQGFDVFDDIIDHSYDEISDPDLRLNAVTDQIKEIDQKYSVIQLARLREDLFLRLQYNYDLAVFYNQSSRYSLDRAIRRLVAKNTSLVDISV